MSLRELNGLGEAKEMAASALHVRIAGELRREIENAAGGSLSPRHILARKYGVSTGTVQAALALLKRDGVIIGGRGRPPRIIDPTESSSDETNSKRPSSWLTIAGYIEKSIVSGEFKAGDIFPKQSHYARLHRISVHTLQKALTHLVDGNVLHRDGRQYLVGGKPRLDTHAGDPLFIPVVLLLLETQRTWLNRLNSSHGNFFRGFEAEAERFGIRMSPVFVDKKNGRREFPAGGREVYAYAKSLGGYYCGVIIPDANFAPEECRQWGRIFDSLKRPSVWFDPRGRFSRDLCGVHSVMCREDEREFVRTGLEHLHMLGHGRIWYGYDPVVAWHEKRSRQLKEIAEKLSPVPQITIDNSLADRVAAGIDKAKQRLTSFASSRDAMLRDRVNEFLALVKRKGLSLSEPLKQNPDMDTFSYFQKLLSARAMNFSWYEDVSTIFRLCAWDGAIDSIRESQSTAVIMPNDAMARIFYNCLLLRNIGIPSDMSLVSYDNAEMRRVYPISSVDRGYLRLGYWAFHVIMDDIPTPVDGNGCIYATPFLRNAGSLGPPAP